MVCLLTVLVIVSYISYEPISWRDTWIIRIMSMLEYIFLRKYLNQSLCKALCFQLEQNIFMSVFMLGKHKMVKDR